MNTFIITGATGFIGKQLTKSIIARFGDQSVVIPLGSKDADLSNRDSTFECFENLHWRHDCDHILHLAAFYRAGDWPVYHQATQFYINMSINVNLLEAWKRYFP